MSELLSINDGLAKGITKFRKPIWAIPDDHIEITVIDGNLGPWFMFFSPANIPIGNPNPVPVLNLSVDLDAKEWEAYQDPAVVAEGTSQQ